MIFSADETADVGIDLATPVVEAIGSGSKSKFTGRIPKVTVEVKSQKEITIEYKGFIREEPLRFDLLVDDCVLIEAKSVQTILPIHKAQLLSYMKLLNVPIGLLINFNEMKLIDGVHRLILPKANQ
jgi:GxxExxY protein